VVFPTTAFGNLTPPVRGETEPLGTAAGSSFAARRRRHRRAIRRCATGDVARRRSTSPTSWDSTRPRVAMATIPPLSCRTDPSAFRRRADTSDGEVNAVPSRKATGLDRVPPYHWGSTRGTYVARALGLGTHPPRLTRLDRTRDVSSPSSRPRWPAFFALAERRLLDLHRDAGEVPRAHADVLSGRSLCTPPARLDLDDPCVWTSEAFRSRPTRVRSPGACSGRRHHRLGRALEPGPCSAPVCLVEKRERWWVGHARAGMRRGRALRPPDAVIGRGRDARQGARPPPTERSSWHLR